MRQLSPDAVFYVEHGVLEVSVPQHRTVWKDLLAWDSSDSMAMVMYFFTSVPEWLSKVGFFRLFHQSTAVVPQAFAMALSL